jgi:hypothetical protein
MGHHARRLVSAVLTMANHPGLCTNPVDCDCWRIAADRLQDDLTRHEQCLENGWTHTSKETT